MKLGIDILVSKNLSDLKGRSIGLLAHQASRDKNGHHILDTLLKDGVKISALFGPEHGFETSAQDMEPVGNSKTGKSAIPTYSLYGQTFDSLKPTREMLSNIDLLIVDLQDIGSRYYTYIYTMALCMQTAAKTGTKVIVCDRPNPINGIDTEGALVEKDFESFVGMYPLPVRHGMTIGELALYFNKEHGIGCELEVIKMDAWRRDSYFDETGIKWVNPSPNMRSLEAALLYPGICLIEGTNISEGRGTEKPFENIGAPFLDGNKLASELNSLKMSGIKFYPTTFTPSMHKWAGKKCEGILMEITDRKTFKPYLAGLKIISVLARFKEFKWRTEEYEFRKDIPAIDMLTGSDVFRKDVASIATLTKTPETFLGTRERYLMY